MAGREDLSTFIKAGKDIVQGIENNFK